MIATPAAPVRSRVVTEDMLRNLPAPVQRYLHYTGVVGQPWIDTVRLRYSGVFRMAKDKPWMPTSVEQQYATNPPGFLWNAHFKMAGVPLMFGRDVYRGGQSHMHGKLFGLFTIVDGQGEEINQGTMVRYLQEMIWFPIAYLGANITWDAVDDHAADVSFHDCGKTVTGRMYFDDAGRLLSFVAQRYGEFKGSFQLRTWSTPISEYSHMAGLNLPSAGAGVWQLPEGDLAYIKMELTHIVYNEALDAF